MDWYNFCKLNFDLKIATTDNLKIYVAKNKITADQYKEITGVDYVATTTSQKEQTKVKEEKINLNEVKQTKINELREACNDTIVNIP